MSREGVGKSGEAALRFLISIADMGRQDAFATFNISSGRGYKKTAGRLHPENVEQHLSGNAPIAVYPLAESTVRFAVLDVDDHDGNLNWSELVDACEALISALNETGMIWLPVRSGGGAGMHFWFFWHDDQLASDVRMLLELILDRAGLRIGTGGIEANEIEVFPKQDTVPPGKFGNPIALPFARKSLPLGPDFTPLDFGSFTPPAWVQLWNSPAAELLDQLRTDASVSEPPNPLAVDHGVPDSVLPGDDQEARDALKYVEAADYETWVTMGLVLKFSFADAGFVIWNEWSQTEPNKYPGDVSARQKWDSLDPDGRVGLGTLFYLAQQGGWNGPRDTFVREMNAKFGILTHRNRTLIILKDSRSISAGGFDWLTLPVFKDRLAPQQIQVEDGNGNARARPIAEVWSKHRRADHYHSIDFDPSKAPGKNGAVWNIWRGFPYEPRPGRWDMLKEHIFENVCRADPELYAWLLNWMALGLQEPSTVIGTAPVLLGLPGTGKGFLVNAYGELWKPHFTTITHQEQVTGRFSSHLFGMRLVFVDEGTFGGNRKDAGVLKTRVTEERVVLEAKGVDAFTIDNRMLFMIASNEASVVPADIADRRWQMFDVGSARREDHPFFGAAKKELVSGGYAGMMFDLQNRDISKGPDPRRTIKSDALFEQVLRAQRPEIRYLYHVLSEARLPQEEEHCNGAGTTTIRALWEEMKEIEFAGGRVPSASLGRFLQSVIPEISTKQNGTYVERDYRGHVVKSERSTRYHFPPLSICRTRFETYLGQTVPWGSSAVEWREVSDGIPI